MKTEPYTQKELEVELKRHDAFRVGTDSGNGRILATLLKLMNDNDQIHAMHCDAHTRIDGVMADVVKVNAAHLALEAKIEQAEQTAERCADRIEAVMKLPFFNPNESVDV